MLLRSLKIQATLPELLMPKPGVQVYMTGGGEVYNSDTRVAGLSDEVRSSLIGSRAARGTLFMTLDDEYAFLLVEDAYREGEK